MNLESDGRIAGARFVASPNCDARPPRIPVTLLLLHSISLPPGEFGGDAIERFFINRLEPQAHPYFRQIADQRVSTHFFVRRSGELVQFVPTHLRAWHAGASAWRGCERCNDFSIGVELEGTDTSEFADAQYATLATLTRSLREAFPLRDVAGHSDVAPARKTDPGERFDWPRFLRDLSRA